MNKLDNALVVIMEEAATLSADFNFFNEANREKQKQAGA